MPVYAAPTKPAYTAAGGPAEKVGWKTLVSRQAPPYQDLPYLRWPPPGGRDLDEVHEVVGVLVLWSHPAVHARHARLDAPFEIVLHPPTTRRHNDARCLTLVRRNQIPL